MENESRLCKPIRKPYKLLKCNLECYILLEFHGQVIDVAKMITRENNAKVKWLDTGCGTGTLALRALGIEANWEKINYFIPKS